VIYTLHQRRGMRSIRLRIDPQGGVHVSASERVSHATIEGLIREKMPWIETQRKKMRERIFLAPPPSKEEYQHHKGRALLLAKERVEYFSSIYGWTAKKITITNPRTRWGSCSEHGAIRFSYRLLFLPDALADYLVVHELCHLKEMNHSRRFWALVAKTIPTYRALSKQLRLG